MSLRLQQHRAKAAIDEKAAEVRRRFISDLVGQDGVYADKLAEARAYIAEFALDANATPGDLIDAEATRRGMGAIELAEEVEAAGTAWLSGARVAIEAERVGGKKDVEAAADEAAVSVALAACLAALDAITP